MSAPGCGSSQESQGENPARPVTPTVKTREQLATLMLAVNLALQRQKEVEIRPGLDSKFQTKKAYIVRLC